MPSIGSILQIAKSGLLSSQEAMNVTAHNISNAHVEGYSRQRAELKAQGSIAFPNAVYGTGVDIDNVARIADPLIEGALFMQLGSQGQHGARAEVLERVEGLFGEPSEIGLGATIDRFFSTFSDLATNPNSPPTRTALRQSASELVDRFHELAAGLDELRQEAEISLDTKIGRANQLLGEVALLNRDIVSQEVNGRTAGDLRDERSRRLTELAELVPIRVTERENGSVGVTTAGVSIADGSEFGQLEVRQIAGDWRLAKVGATNALTEQGGALGGLTDFLNNDLPNARQQLDELAEALVTDVNTAHVTGTNALGTTGIDFFDSAGLSASTIALSADVLADPQAISAGTPDGSGAYRAGANDIALTIAGLRDTPASTLGISITDHYNGLVLDVGTAVRSSGDAARVHETLAEQAELRRMSLSGVSVDEELVKLIEFQSAYQSSARVITVAEEMIQTLLTM